MDDKTNEISHRRRLADEGDSKSLVLITRVGSTPTTGIESSSKSKGFGLLFFFIPLHPVPALSGQVRVYIALQSDVGIGVA